MDVSIEKTSNIGRRLTITVPAQEIDNLYARKQNDVAKTASIKGFRPGKVPKPVLMQRFGSAILQETLNEAIHQNLLQALRDHHLDPVGTPRIEPKKFDLGQPLAFSVIFDVLPEIEKVHFSVEQLEKCKTSVTEEDINRVIEQLSKQHTKWQKVDRDAALKDLLVIDFYPIYANKAELEDKNTSFSLQLGSKMMFPGFEEGLLGAKAGDERTLSLVYPSDFSVAERANQPVEFHVTVHQVYEGAEPELNEEFIKKLDIASGQLEDLKAHIRETLEQECERLVNEKLKTQIFDQLLIQNPLDIPQSLVEQEAKRIHDEVYQHRDHHHHAHAPEELSLFDNMAKKRVALSLLLKTYIQQNSLQADQSQVKQRIEQIASNYKEPEKLVAWLSTDEQRKGIESAVLEDGVVAKLMEGVTIKEKAVSYVELKGGHLQTKDN